MSYLRSTLTNLQRRPYQLTKNKIIVTPGSKGVGYADNGEIHIVPGFKVEPVDTTGAGDTFNGAFATAIVNGKSLADALHYGNAAAALSIQRLGAQGGMPTKDEVAAFLAKSQHIEQTFKAPLARSALRRAKVALKGLFNTSYTFLCNECICPLYNKGS